MKNSEGLEFWAKLSTEIDENGYKTIESILVASMAAICSGKFGRAEDYVEITEFHNGSHPCCQVGGKYIPSTGKLTCHCPSPGWVIDETLGEYVPPTPSPGDDYHWDGVTQSWVQEG
jgi:hypothetical protein